MSATFAELRFNHLSLSDFVPDPHRANDLRGQILDEIVDCLFSVAPEIKSHPQYRLQDLRSDVRLELNLKDLQMETCLFSAIAVLPTWLWISDLYKGVRSLGGCSFSEQTLSFRIVPRSFPISQFFSEFPSLSQENWEMQWEAFWEIILLRS